MEYIEHIERYLLGEMSQDERRTFEALVDNNPSLHKELTEYEQLFKQFEHAKNEAFVKQQILIAREQDSRTTQNITTKLQKHVNKYWRTAAIAASVAILASLTTFWIVDNAYMQQEDERILQLVNKEVRAIKKKQVRIQNDLAAVKTNVAPDYPSNGSGTAFALDKRGYAITNLHVINGGKKVFIFTKDGKAHKCDIVLKNEENDIAVLKINDSNFQFSNKAVPYQLNKDASLAASIFTLGYPKNEVVYNEGYISSLNGKDGDSSKYQLELPSSPGVSGAPVLDIRGNLIGIVNSKESQSKGITYAIKSNIVQQILDSLGDTCNPIELKQNALAGKNRTDQIKALEDFVFVVKVYK